MFLNLDHTKGPGDTTRQNCRERNLPKRRWLIYVSRYVEISCPASLAMILTEKLVKGSAGQPPRFHALADRISHYRVNLSFLRAGRILGSAREGAD
jgi:hypothetical protein